jgi:uncharacterized Zn finger protein
VPRELVAEKAKRYLGEGRVIVTAVGPGSATASVRGDGAVWIVTYSDHEWACTCPNRTTCTHLRAVRLVTAPDHPEQR